MHPVTNVMSVSGLYGAAATIWINNHPGTSAATMTAAGMVIIPFLGVALHLFASWLKTKVGVALPIDDDSSTTVDTTTTVATTKGT